MTIPTDDQMFDTLSDATQKAVILIGMGESMGVQETIFIDEAHTFLENDPDASLFPLRMRALTRLAGLRQNIDTAEQKMDAEHVEAIHIMYERLIDFLGAYDPREGNVDA